MAFSVSSVTLYLFYIHKNTCICTCDKGSLLTSTNSGGDDGKDNISTGGGGMKSDCCGSSIVPDVSTSSGGYSECTVITDVWYCSNVVSCTHECLNNCQLRECGTCFIR